MLCLIKAREKVSDVDLRPGTVMDVPDHAVPDLVARGVVQPIEQVRLTNLGGEGWVLRKR